MNEYSVLMSVYHREQSEHLRESIQSMLDQTVRTTDFVIVCDGPLTDELDKVLDSFTEQYPTLFQIIRLPRNLGIGGAANEGIRHCKHDLIAKMDSDDIAKPSRCEKQLRFFSDNPELSVLGAALEEFEGTPDHVVAVRNVPLSHEEIHRYAKRRMPFNNPTVMYRKSAVEAAGGYSDLRRCEDYELYARMIHKGYRMQNIDEILLSYRLTEDAYKRRGMRANLYGFIKVRWVLFRRGFSGFFDFLIPSTAQILISIMPNFLRQKFYLKYLRK